MERTYTKIGDIFSVKLENNSRKYFQYVARDSSQLNSDVVRVFKKEYSAHGNHDLSQVIKGEIEFYAHCVIRRGTKLGFWEKVGNVTEIGKTEVLFRDSCDYGNPEVEVSDNWYIWKINEDFRKVGKLIDQNKKAEIGIVISPDSIVHRIKMGKYDFVYPRYE